MATLTTPLSEPAEWQVEDTVVFKVLDLIIYPQPAAVPTVVVLHVAAATRLIW